MNETRWRKSTYSSNGGASCIEVGQAAHVIAIRDTKQLGRGPVLRFTPAAWRRFAEYVKRSLASQLKLAFIDPCWPLASKSAPTGDSARGESHVRRLPPAGLAFSRMRVVGWPGMTDSDARLPPLSAGCDSWALRPGRNF